jgi:GNAT superfamily N-acetyltransferase
MECLFRMESDFMLHKIEWRRPRREDKHELELFFETAIKDTFAKEGLSHWVEDIEHEIESKKQYLEDDLTSNGEYRYFIIAIDKGTNNIIGSIEYGPASNLIQKCTNGLWEGLYGIGTVFVHPDYQNGGIGSSLLNRIFLIMSAQGIEEFVLDSGYTRAQQIWKKKFGEPNVIMKDFWGEGYDHWIWRKRIKDMFKDS